MASACPEISNGQAGAQSPLRACRQGLPDEGRGRLAPALGPPQRGCGELDWSEVGPLAPVTLLHNQGFWGSWPLWQVDPELTVPAAPYDGGALLPLPLAVLPLNLPPGLSPTCASLPRGKGLQPRAWAVSAGLGCG